MLKKISIGASIFIGSMVLTGIIIPWIISTNNLSICEIIASIGLLAISAYYMFKILKD